MAETRVSTTPTLLFSDIQGSTSLLQRVGPLYADLLGRHRAIVRAAIEEFGGLERGTEGDSFFVTFDSPKLAIAASVAVQRAHEQENWPPDAPLRVRIGVHLGEASETSAGLVGLAIHHAARIAASAHGGQIVVSGPARDEVAGLPPQVGLRSLGTHRLRDVGEITLYQVTHPDIADEFPPLRTQGAARHNLPAALSTLIGRATELQTIADMLVRHRLVTLTGAGGCGKTRLALRAASDAGARFVDGVWFIELAALSDGEQIMSVVAEAIGVRGEDAAIIDAVRDRAMLFVFDNCEHLVGASGGVVSRLLAAGPKLAVLATSREPLGIMGEALFRVPSLSLPARDGDAHDVLASEAGRLFVERARLVRPDFVPTELDAGAISEICRRLDGIPLAIELAAARSRMLSPTDIAGRLDDRFRLLTGGSRSALPRQQTLQATVDWSFRLLTPDEQTMMIRMAVFQGGSDLLAIERVCAEANMDGLDVLDIVASLQDKSLVLGADVTVPRFRMSETVRQYAAERLLNRDDVVGLRDRHAAHYVSTIDQAVASRRSGALTELARVCDDDGDNLRAAAIWLLDADPETSLRLLCELSSAAIFWHGMNWVAELTTLALDRAVGASVELRAVAHAQVASSALFGYVDADVEAHRTEAARLVDSVSDPRSFARALSILTFQSAAMSTNALDVDAVGACCKAADESGVVATRFEVRMSLLHTAPFTVAEPMIATLIALSRELSEPGLEQLWTLELAVHLGFAGRTAEALDMVRNGLLDLDHLTSTGDTLQTAVFAALLEGEHGDITTGLDLSRDLYERLWMRTRDPLEEAMALSVVARLELLDGDLAQAEVDALQAVARAAPDQPDYFLHALARVTLAACLRHRGEFTTAGLVLARRVGGTGTGSTDRWFRVVEEAALLCHALGRTNDAASLLATAADWRTHRRMVVAPASQSELFALAAELGPVTGQVLDAEQAASLVESLAHL